MAGLGTFHKAFTEKLKDSGHGGGADLRTVSVKAMKLASDAGSRGKPHPHGAHGLAGLLSPRAGDAGERDGHVAPEDATGAVHIAAGEVSVGDIVTVDLVDSFCYELIGEIVEEGEAE